MNPSFPFTQTKTSLLAKPSQIHIQTQFHIHYPHHLNLPHPYLSQQTLNQQFLNLMAHHHLSQILQLLLKSTHQTPTSLINISKNHHLTMLYHVTPAATLILLLTFLIISFKFLPSSLLKPHQPAYIPFRVSSHTLMSLLLIAISL